MNRLVITIENGEITWIDADVSTHVVIINKNEGLPENYTLTDGEEIWIEEMYSSRDVAYVDEMFSILQTKKEE